MTRVVADETLGKIARQQHDLFRRVREGKLDPNEVSRGLQALIEGKNGSVSIFLHDQNREGWILVEGFDEPDPVLLSSVAEFEFVPILRGNESYISGEEIRRRASQADANYGQRAAEWLLVHPKKIPARPEGVCWVLFPRTGWRHLDGSLIVSCLFWNGKQWTLGFRWFEGGVSDCRFLRPRK